MKTSLLFGFLAATAIAVVNAQTNTYTTTGSETNITLAAGTYQIIAYGASGGNEVVAGGLGAEISGDFTFLNPTVLTILVGSAGYSGTYAGGGGGSFVSLNGTPWVIAGGGGGAGANIAGGAGGAGVTGTTGGTGGTGGGGAGYAGGTSGSGGSAGSLGKGGGGFSGNGANGGGQSFENGGNGSGFGGGFGGGGGAGGAGASGSAGGGGGYSGGGAGGAQGGGGGGGASYIDASATNTTAISGANSGDGLVTIITLAVPEPSTYALLGLGALAFVIVCNRRRSA